jgi:hypothetical protein
MIDTKQLDIAFLKAKASFRKTGKTGKNNHQGWDYAKIEDIYNAVEASLASEGIFIRHVTDHVEDKYEILITRMVHAESGQYIEDRRLIKCDKPGNQARGAAETYCRKYAVLSLCAISTEDDDCQNEQDYIDNDNEYIDATKVAYLKGWSKEGQDRVLAHNNIKDLSQLTNRQFEKLMTSMKKGA